MLSVSYAGKIAYSASKISGVLRGDASGATPPHLTLLTIIASTDHPLTDPQSPLLHLTRNFMRGEKLRGRKKIIRTWCPILQSLFFISSVKAYSTGFGFTLSLYVPPEGAKEWGYQEG